MPRKISILPSTALGLTDPVEEIQADLGLVRTVETKNGSRKLLTSVELGRRAGLPGKWGAKGYNANLVAAAAGLIHKHNGRWAPTEKGKSHTRKVDGRLFWYHSGVPLVQDAVKAFDWRRLMGSNAKRTKA